ncbi:hypothetical protein [Leucobacter chromiireducens]|uniref:hypothetical protein n=1 Tax=Leucobacter chromiireducens TaxID=283877 RepID=UPI003F7E389E
MLRTRAKQTVLTVLCAGALLLSGCANETTATVDPDPVPSETPETIAGKTYPPQEELLAELAAVDTESLSDDCSALVELERINTLTAQLSPQSVGDTLDERLAQTSGLFAQLSAVSEFPDEAESWSSIANAATSAEDALAAYGGTLGNAEVLTALGELSIAFQSAADAHAEELAARCGVDLQSLLATGD